MATIDLSRSATDFRKHYISVRAQQGRVFVDDDHNENERLHGEDERRSRVDIIGPSGSPDDGFLISNPKITANAVDFDINKGAFYLGGLRLELEQVETFQTQSDWLQLASPDKAAAPDAPRFDLVYLEAWLQAVSAVEDNELFEVALAGPDTSTRMRVMRRVRVLSGAKASDCQTDWQNLIAQLKASGLGALNDENELVADTNLKVEFEPGANPADLCSPPVAGGYLGAENQAIRVQLIDSTHFTWGFDNAAPLYRVQVGTNGAGQKRVIHTLNEPKDQAHWPLAGQIVELLPWSAVLPNNEKLAERSGFLARVDSSYDPDAKQFTITASVPAGFGGAWKTRADAVELGTEFFYLRVWNRGSDTTSQPSIAFTPGTAVSLGQTGLKINITGNDRRRDDYWIIAARPESPNRVVPWLLEQGRAPHGVRRFIAPLAVIEWSVANNIATGKVVHDCRDVFPPLTRLRSCCTYTVGDGTNSFGMFLNVQDAIDHLPAGGGEVCILPGTYRENIKVVKRENITIHGCGRRTLLLDKEDAPVIHVEDSQRITIKNLAIQSRPVVAVNLLSNPAASKEERGLERIHIDNLEIDARDQSAINCRGGRFINITNCEIQFGRLREPLSSGSVAGRSAAVFVMADDVLIERNRIVCDIARRSISALGGIHIGGGSERVEIRRNRIIGGNGNGITLGSITYIPQAAAGFLLTDYVKVLAGGLVFQPGFFLFIGDDDCPHPDPDPKDPRDPNGDPLVPVSDGDLRDIRIIENDILDMGLNGIATLRFPVKAREARIFVRDLDIELNRIRKCVQLDLGERPFSANFPYGYGGVSLAACEYLTARNNWIERNGRSFVDPICGVYVLAGAGLLIEQNQITDNGPLTDAQRQPTPGPRGGIVVERALTPVAEKEKSFALTRRDGFPALRVSDNVVISPLGPALQAFARGLVFVEGNQLTSLGVEPRVASPEAGGIPGALAQLGGATVRIFNAGISSDFQDLAEFTGFSPLRVGLHTDGGNLRATELVPQFPRQPSGNVLFNDNQVLLAPAEVKDDVIQSSILIISGDDISMEGNQCDCRLNRQRLLMNALVIGISIRVSDNRFKETLDGNGVSAVTVGLMNSTAHNEGTRCFIILGMNALSIKGPNRSLITLIDKGLCESMNSVVAQSLKNTIFEV